MVRNLLITAMIGANILLWTIAYLGYTSRQESQTQARIQPQIVVRTAELQLLKLEIPIASHEGWRLPVKAPVMVVVTLGDRHWIPYVCRFAPKIQDAILQFMHKYPPRQTLRGGLDFHLHIPHLLAATNKILQRPYAVGVEVAEIKSSAAADNARFFKMRQCQLLAKPTKKAAK